MQLIKHNYSQFNKQRSLHFHVQFQFWKPNNFNDLKPNLQPYCPSI